MVDAARSSQVDKVIEYFRRIDTGDFARELFNERFRFYMPKYGVGEGVEEFMDMSQRVGARAVQSIRHHTEQFVIIEQGKHVTVEGTTEGVGTDGVRWHGGRTPGGRFCSIFTFDNRGLIERMYVYLDPDFSGKNRDDYFAPARTPQRW